MTQSPDFVTGVASLIIQRMSAQPLVPGGEGAVALEAVAFFFVADLFAEVFFEGWEEVEGDVGGLEVFGFGVGDVVGE